MEKLITISVQDAILFEKLLIANRDTLKLQKITNVGYTESIEILNKLRKKLNR